MYICVEDMDEQAIFTTVKAACTGLGFQCDAQNYKLFDRETVTCPDVDRHCACPSTAIHVSDLLAQIWSYILPMHALPQQNIRKGEYNNCVIAIVDYFG